MNFKQITVHTVKEKLKIHLRNVYSVYGPVYPAIAMIMNIVYFPIAVANPIYIVVKSYTDVDDIPHRNKFAASTVPFFGIIIAEYIPKKLTWVITALFVLGITIQNTSILT